MNDFVAASEKGPSASLASVRAGAPTRRSANTGVAASENPLSSVIVERSSRRKPGKRAKVSSRAARSARVASPTVVDSLMNDETRSFSAASSVMIASESLRKALERPVLAGKACEHLVGLAERRVRPLDDLLELVATRRQGCAQVVEDQAEAVRIGLAHDVVDQVEVHGLAVLLQRQQVLALAALAIADHLELGRSSRCRPPGAASAGTPRTSLPGATAEKMWQEASWRKSWKPASSI